MFRSVCILTRLMHRQLSYHHIMIDIHKVKGECDDNLWPCRDMLKQMEQLRN